MLNGLTHDQFKALIEDKLEAEGFPRNLTFAQYFHIPESRPQPAFVPYHQRTIHEVVRESMTKPEELVSSASQIKPSK